MATPTDTPPSSAVPSSEIPISPSNLWIDGCFDFFHHGHVGVMLQARRLGTSLTVGLHSDSEISRNKGPVVMTLAERVAAVEACRFATTCVPNAPYVTDLECVSAWGCRDVVHGDDVTSDAGGEDCYRFVKRAGRMRIVPRTPGISTTDLVGRMLGGGRGHFIRDLKGLLEEKEEVPVAKEGKDLITGANMLTRIREYAAAPNGLEPFVAVFVYTPAGGVEAAAAKKETNGTSHTQHTQAGHQLPTSPPLIFTPLVTGLPPQPDQRIVYIDGSFDLFSSGHIAFLETITKLEHDLASSSSSSSVDGDWFSASRTSARIERTGYDYPPAYIIAGVHADETVNTHTGANYPIMNIFERGLCVVQCKYIHCVIFSAPLVPTKEYLGNLPFGPGVQRAVDAVYHGPTAAMHLLESDPYAEAKGMGVFEQVDRHRFQEVDARDIVGRIMERRGEYEERQRKKGAKAVGEEAVWREEKERAGREANGNGEVK